MKIMETTIIIFSNYELLPHFNKTFMLINDKVFKYTPENKIPEMYVLLLNAF